MRSLIIPDIHNKVEIADQLIDHTQPDEVIFIGDYFDYFEDTPEDAAKVARWLKPRLHTPGYHMILGNHDAAYRWPKANWTVCTGYTKDKQEAIDEILSPKDWERTLLAVERGNFWITHAGLHPGIFCHPILGFDPQRVWDLLHEAEFKTTAGIHTPITDEQRAQGDAPSGPLWLRWEEFTPMEEINQIVGHTAYPSPQTLHTGNSQNFNLDCFLQFYAILKDNNLEILPNPFAPEMRPDVARGIEGNLLRLQRARAQQNAA